MKTIIYCLLLLSLNIFFLPLLFSQNYQLVWSDEFNGTKLDSSKWSCMSGNGCDESMCAWGVDAWNMELTNNEMNVKVENGFLKITDRKQSINGSIYTSAHISSVNKASWRYGRIEARMKLPEGKGLWPGFWMMSVFNKYGNWPLSGELDIMEMRGSNTNTILGTVHYGNVWPLNKYYSTNYSLSSGKFSDDFHIIGIEWSENKIEWFVDSTIYASATPASLNGQFWPYNEEFFVMFNLIIDGNFDGAPDANTILPAEMDVDYIRVYSKPEYFIIHGKSKVYANDSSVLYSVDYNQANTYSWTVPQGASILSGTDSNVVVVNWGTAGGDIKVNVQGNAGNADITMNVNVFPKICEVVFEDFDGNKNLSISTGIHYTATNPAPDNVNISANVGMFFRPGQPWNVSFPHKYYDLMLENATDYETGKKEFCLDVYTEEPAGTPITLLLENFAMHDNSYYTIRSTFKAVTSKQNSWETLTFKFDHLINPGSSPETINRINLIFADGRTLSSNIYYDNFRRKDLTISGCSNLGNNEPQLLSNVKLYPMPLNDILTLEINLTEGSDVFVNIKNILGQTIYSTSFESVTGNEKKQLDLQHLQKGLYIFEAITNNKIIIQKIMKD